MMRKSLLIAAACLLVVTQALGAEQGGHPDPVGPVLAALIVILVASKLGSEIFERLGQPAVLGELIAGVVLGNMVLLDPRWAFFEPLRATEITVQWAVVVDMLARVGVIILLFEVGLESNIQEMIKVGPSAALVAVLGVIAPFVLGFGASALFIRELPASLAARVPASFSLNYVHMFVGAVLCATSVGITARVFKDLGRLQTREAQIILGAAVIDDVLGLIVLAVVSGVISSAELGEPVQLTALARLTGLALGFLGGSLLAGKFLVPKLLGGVARARTSGVMLVSALVLAFGLAYLARAAGLAAIVGAFAAGLLLEEVHFRRFREEISIHMLIRPISTLLVPIFFVLMGIQVRLETFADPSVLGVAAGLTVAAILGKQVCGLGIVMKGVDRLTIGAGMIPRGEVGLIFASIGKGLGVVDSATLSAIVIMVIITTLIAPPALKWTLARAAPPDGSAPAVRP